MAEKSTEFNASRPWLRGGFDFEGLAGAAAALLFGIFAGAFWYPLFLIGFLAAILVLAATRRVDRSLPDRDFSVLAPCDGVVASIGPAVPPAELRMEGGELTRIRIASSPLSPNPLFAPVTGEVSTSIHEEGEPSQVFASGADAHGLTSAYITIGEGKDAVGLKIMAGGFGPRLDVDVEGGDMLRAGRKFGKRRLGGWCDVYLSDGLNAAVWPGQTLVGAETELAQRPDDWVVREAPKEEVRQTEPDMTLEDLGGDYDPADADDASARLFERLRREAQGLEDTD